MNTETSTEENQDKKSRALSVGKKSFSAIQEEKDIEKADKSDKS
jgi:hypothetical protein